MPGARIYAVKRLLGGVLIAAAVTVGAVAYAWLRPLRGKPLDSFIVIVVDSLRADHLGTYGYPRPTTPRLDALAREGVVFENAFSQAPWTKPSVASLFTSSYISVHHVLFSRRVVEGQDRTDILNEKFLTLAEAMNANGFATGGFGQKIHLRPDFGFDQGFQQYDMHARRAENVNRIALSWLEDNDPDRFFIYLHYNDPHYPYKPDPEDARFGATSARVQITGETKKAFREGKLHLTPEDMRQLVDLYDGEIFYTDRHIGDLMDAVGALGYEKVTVIVTADHGEEFLDHGDITHGQSLYAEQVRVPFIVSGSGLDASARGMRSALKVELIDIMPTLLEMAGLPLPPHLQGKSLNPLLSGGAGHVPAGYIFSERRDPLDAKFSRTIFDGRWKLIHNHPGDLVMLFDIEADPGETLPLTRGNQQVAADLMSRLEIWSDANRTLYERLRPEESRPLDPDTEQRLRSLGYLQ